MTKTWRNVLTKAVGMLLILLLLATACPVSAETEWEEVTASFDFEQEETGAKPIQNSYDTDFSNYWFVSNSWVPDQPPGLTEPVIAEENGNKFLRINSYYTAVYDGGIGDYLDFNFDFRTQTDAALFSEYLGGIFLHAAEEVFQYADWDGYKENGGNSTEANISFIGSSGLILVPRDNVLRICVKTYQEDGVRSDINISYGVATEYVDLALGEETTGRFFRVQVLEENQVLQIKVDGNLLAVVELADPGQHDGAEEEYYRSVTIKDPEGNTLLATDHSLVTVESSIVIGTRGRTRLDLDNLVIKTRQEKQEATPTPEDTGSSTPPQTPVVSQSPQPTSVVTPDDGNGWVLPVVIVAAVVAAGIVCAIFLGRKKAKKQ